MAEVCRALGLEDVFLVTQSFGGTVGLTLLQQAPSKLRIEALYAFAPNWFVRPRKWREVRGWLPGTAKLLWRLGRRSGFLGNPVRGRIDYESYAGRRDVDLPRMSEELRSLSWRVYALRFLALQRSRHRRTPDWQEISTLPVSIFAARRDTMVQNAELEGVSAQTGWSLDWVDCGHLGVATEQEHADAWVRALLSRRANAIDRPLGSEE